MISQQHSDTPETARRGAPDPAAGSEPPGRTTLWSRLGPALRVGLICALLGMALATVGIVRGAVPHNALSIFLALLVSGGSWGIVSWAIVTAVVDVERDA